VAIAILPGLLFFQAKTREVLQAIYEFNPELKYRVIPAIGTNEGDREI
jgi:hypothetical protein